MSSPVSHPSPSSEFALRLANVGRTFGSVSALTHVSLDLRPGEIHALVGENGAGKSTLAAIAAGTLAPTSGRVVRNGTVGLVHQHFQLAGRLRVWENVLLGREPRRGPRIDVACARATVRASAERFGLDVDPDAVVERLPVGVAQRVEILRELVREPAVLLLDEPTAVLSPPEIDALFTTLRRLAEGGTAVLVITHKLNEVLRHGDRATVLRAGAVAARIDDVRTAELEAIARAMVGGAMPPLAARAATTLRPGLAIRGLSTAATPGTAALHDVELDVRGGEIVGIAGVEGNGQSALAGAVAGLIAYDGTIALAGRGLEGVTARERIAAGLRAVPQDRLREGLVPDWPIAANVALGDHARAPIRRGALVDRRAVDAEAREIVRRFDVRTPGIATPVRSLSGGNQQKLVVGRALARSPLAVLAYQPTRGIDVGAATLVQSRLIDARNAGVALLVVSFELDELFALCDRIVVFFGGRIVGGFGREAFDRRRIGALMAGA